MSGILRHRDFRKTSQFILPVLKKALPESRYDIYPSFKTGNNKIFEGYDTLAERIKGQKLVVIDGYSGIFFNLFQEQLESILSKAGISTKWISTEALLKPEDEIEELTGPFLGGDDPLFGRRTTLSLEDFFSGEKLKKIIPDPDADINFIIGPGAALVPWEGLMIYVDIPKNEIQYRARAGSVSNLGSKTSSDPKKMYKQYYFVDWIVLNKHKKSFFLRSDIYIDGQRPESPVWIEGSDLREALIEMSRNLIRPRPWFEPGSWGGTWIRDNIIGLNKNIPNYAWSFELISPENGLLIESSSYLLEVSFDCLMYLAAEAVLGDCYPKFGTDFPIRFDFLDTYNGGNLSIQCHPRPSYTKEYFGEDFTQEETYYILDTRDNAVVFLGFRENVNPDEFRKDLEYSYSSSQPFDHEKYIQQHPVKKHDFLLIPYGTIHSAGKNNLVLEISSTPYIFTFKMFDWLRPDLDGKPRTLNIGRAIDNLYFERNGSYVRDNLISKPQLIDEGSDWQLYHLPTHDSHFYDVHRYHFKTIIDIQTDNKFFVMNLTEGTSIEVQTENGLSQKFCFAETFIIPSAARSVRIINNSGTEAVLVKSFVKQEIDPGNRRIKAI